MPPLLRQLQDLFAAHAGLLWLAAAVSLFMLLASLVLVPVVVVRMPADYYRRERRPSKHRLLHLVLLIFRNVLGIVVLLAGIAMLVLPGQGILTMLVGLALIDLPGKRRAELWLLRRGAIRRSLDWLRRRAGRPPLEL